MIESKRVCRNPGEARFAAIYEGACRRVPAFKKASRWAMYYLMAHFVRQHSWSFMNYGYAPLTADVAPLTLEAEDEPNRYCIQLYHHVAGAADLSGRRVLEVGSGRGGGSAFIKRYLGPAEMVGVDYSKAAVRLCRRAYHDPGLRFVHGDAEALPFDDAGFDAVVNVESSHCYASMPRFLSEVTRVLRPGGHFLFADFRWARDLPLLETQLADGGLELVRREDITPNVIAALDLDNARKLAQIRELAPRWLGGMMEEFAGSPGTRIHNLFSDGSAVYISCVLRRM